MVLYEIVTAPLPLKVAPLADPEPPLLIVSALLTLPAIFDVPATIFHVPVAFAPVVLGAPMVLYEIVTAPLPLNVLPLAAPEPPLLIVSALDTDPALPAVNDAAVPVRPVPAPLN